MKDIWNKLKCRHDLKEMSWKQRTLVVLPIALLSLVVVFGSFNLNYDLSQLLALAGIADTPPRAVILVDEPVWFANRQATTASRTVLASSRGYAPFPVFFQGWQSEPRNGIEYLWNFGDSNAYTNPDNSGNPNVLTGFNSAHVFEKPGTYTVTLTVKNRKGAVSQDSVIVTVLDRKDYVSPTGVPATVYYVAPDGDDSYSGKCETKSTADNCGPWKTAQRVFDNLRETSAATKFNPNDSVLFKRGGTYTFNKGYSSAVAIDRLLFSTYGTGNKPIIQYDTPLATPGGTLIKMSAGSGNVSFVDLDFRFKSVSSLAQFGGVLQGVGMNKNLTALRVNAQDLQSQFFSFGKPSGSNPAVIEAVNTGIFVFDSKFSVSDAQYSQDAINNNKGVNGTFDATMIYGYMGSLALVGNTFDRSYNHLTYLTHLNKATIINNNFSRPAFGRNALRIDGGLINGKGTNNVYVADNKIMGWRDLSLSGGDNGGSVHNGNGAYNYQLINIGPNGNHDQALSFITFERNILTNFLWGIKIADADNIIIRNNLFVSPNQEKRTSGVIVIGDRDWEWRPVRDIVIIGNTFAIQSLSHVVPNPTAIFYIQPFNKNNGYSVITQHQNINISNNLIYRPINSSSVVTAFSYKPPIDLVAQLHFDGNLYNVRSTTNDKIFSYYVWGKNSSGNDVVLSTESLDLKQWQDTYGFDLKSQATSSDIVASLFNILPVFYLNDVGTPDLATNLSQADNYKRMFNLKNDPTNPAIDHGVNLGASLSFDFNGLARPNGLITGDGSYDVGAFEVYRKPNTSPVADFSFSSNPLATAFDFLFDASGSADTDGSIISYLWDFGDGSSSASGQTANHTYSSEGDYEAKLTVADNDGASSLISKIVKVVKSIVEDKTKNVTVMKPIVTVLNFSFEDSDINTIIDSSGSNNNGHGVDIVSVSGISGQAYSFNGSSSYISVPSSDLLNQTDSLTISVAVKPKSWTGNARIIQKGNRDNQYRLTAEKGQLIFHVVGPNVIVYSSLPPTDGTWHQVIANYSPSDKVATISIDGQQTGKRYANGNAIAVTNDPLYIGTKNAAANSKDSFDGDIDEVKITN